MLKSTIISVVCFVLAATTAALAQPPTNLWQIQAYTSQVSDLEFTANGQTIVTSSGLSNNPINFWSTGNGALQQSVEMQSTSILSIDVSSDGQYLAAGYIVSGYPPGSLTRVWHLPDQNVVDDFGGAYASFSPDAARIASGGGSVNRYLTVHNIITGDQIFSVYTGNYITTVLYSPEGMEIATGGTDNNVKLWNAENGSLMHTLTGHTDDVSAVAFSHDGNILASGEGGFDGGGQASIKLWDVESGTLLRTLSGFNDWVYDLDFSPDNQYLLTSGRESTSPLLQKIKIWRVSDGELMAEYEASASCLSYSPDGQYFAYGSPYGGLYLAENPLATNAISITLTPADPPIMIPASGGSFDFNIEVANNGSETVTFEAWTMAELPDGSMYGPIINPVTITLNNNGSVDRDRTQNVPSGAPSGTYTYYGYVGVYPNTIWLSNSFDFDKSEAFDGALVNNWENTGESFSLPDENSVSATPTEFGLTGAYPNPFNPQTSISYSLAEAGQVNLKVYDVQGREVVTLAQGFRSAGHHQVVFNAANMPSGVYFARLYAGGKADTKKLILLK